ncbi:hypothetical protein CTA2_7421 [Colletotrichum tanaceti]|uniref:Uncharacterized protein n=1 Tax=Colletotrichum tanaceti TaxID=1306861 RepID=A0A4U6XW01_9PEZI|nr:hypothetical protein CTA2_7421 [Colletotrichum tanaceti]TKW60172.1 hypothetical protein CTA1_4721 [Colletotrichum tanaceti]
MSDATAPQLSHVFFYQTIKHVKQTDRATHTKSTKPTTNLQTRSDSNVPSLKQPPLLTDNQTDWTMPPYEAPHTVQVPRYTEGEASTSNSSDVPGLVAAITVLSIFCVLALLAATIQRRQFLKARESQKETAGSLNGVCQNFSSLRENHETQSEDVFRLQKVVKRFVPSAQSSCFPQATTEQGASGTAHGSEATKHKQEYNPEPRAPFPQHEDVFVVGCDDEEEEEKEEEEDVGEQNTEYDARARDSRQNSRRIETDPSAPRFATMGVVHTGARLSSEESASARF